MLGKHKEDKKEVAIKFMDVSENSNIFCLFTVHIFSGIGKYDIRYI